MCNFSVTQMKDRFWYRQAAAVLHFSDGQQQRKQIKLFDPEMADSFPEKQVFDAIQMHQL